MTVYKKITNSIFILTTDKVKPINLFNNLNISHILVVTIEELQKISGGSIHNFGYVLHYATSTKFNTNDEKNDFDKSIDLTVKILDIVESTNTVPHFINLSGKVQKLKKLCLIQRKK